jgi:hypothetical protein
MLDKWLMWFFTRGSRYGGAASKAASNYRGGDPLPLAPVVTGCNLLVPLAPCTPAQRPKVPHLPLFNSFIFVICLITLLCIPKWLSVCLR